MQSFLEDLRQVNHPRNQGNLSGRLIAKNGVIRFFQLSAQLK